jgi:hypothetical protein
MTRPGWKNSCPEAQQNGGHMRDVMATPEASINRCLALSMA